MDVQTAFTCSKIQSQQRKNQSDVQNMLKVNNTPERRQWRRSAVFIVKACVRYFLSNDYFSPDDGPLKTMKNVYYFI